MKSLLDKNAYQEAIQRIQNLHPELEPQWGKMNVAQMQAHLQQSFKVPLSETPMPRMFIGRLIGWMVKPKLYNAEPFKRNLPTAPDFVIKDNRDFVREQLNLLEIVEEFHSKGPDGIGNHPHPMFGTFTKDQWGIAMYKHLDHHLTQFGV
jgi:hypothetical protein